MSERDEDRLADLVTLDGALVVGVGQPLRGDDAVGPLVAERLAARFPSRVIDAGPVPESFLGPLAAEPGRPVVFIDAALTGEAPGAWVLAGPDSLARSVPDTHRASLRLLAELLSQLGVPTWVLGIAPMTLVTGAPLSPPVARTADDLVAILTAALAEAPVHA